MLARSRTAFPVQYLGPVGFPNTLDASMPLALCQIRKKELQLELDQVFLQASKVLVD